MRVTARVRHSVLVTGIAALASLGTAGPAAAQGAQPVAAPAAGFGFFGVPEHTSVETGIPFYTKAAAELADKFTINARNAVAKCDRTAYAGAFAVLNGYAAASSTQATTITGDAILAGRFKRDADNMALVVAQLPPYPDPCPPGTSAASASPVSIYVIGGGRFPFSGTGATTGTDFFFGPDAGLIDNRPISGAQHSNPFLGLRARHQAGSYFFKRPDVTPEESNVLWGDYFYVEVGIQSAFGATSFEQNFTGINGVPLGFGQQSVRENFQIPIQVGFSFPLVAPTPNGTPVFLDLSAGVTFDNWTHQLSGAEAGAPGGLGFGTTIERFTVNPTFGLGVRSNIGNFLTVGIGGELQFLRPGNVITARSNNFGTQTYYGTVDPQANFQLFLRLGLPLN